MVFSSGLFLFYFFPIFLLGYLLIPVKYKNAFALLGSLFFYTWGAPEFLPWVLVGIVLDFIVGRQIHKNSRFRPLHWLWIGLAANLALLLYFKYANFFVENASQLLGINDDWWKNIALPIGISFFTFQKMSYLIDVYQKKVQAARNLVDYALYVLLFPQLIAGPIVRYKEIAAQIVDRESLDNDIPEKLAGLSRFAIGLAKKVLIADVLGREVDAQFASEDLSSPTAWIVILAYCMQIYFDFSGYSDMAIGIGRMMGFKFPENFNFPYLSKSITEFWRRWHITLSNWMRDYLYIPLGGNRIGNGRTYLNLWVVFLISGLWHGASWNFVIWGAFHGLMLSVERLAGGGLLRKLGSLPSQLLTFFLVLMSWVVFRAKDMEEARQFYGHLFAWNGQLDLVDPEFWAIFVVAALLTVLPGISFLRKNYLRLWDRQEREGMKYVQLLLIFVLMILSISEVMVADYSPFIYFRF